MKRDQEGRMRRLESKLLEAVRSGDIELQPQELDERSLVKVLLRKMGNKPKQNRVGQPNT